MKKVLSSRASTIACSRFNRNVASAVTDIGESDRQGSAEIDPNLTGQRGGFFSIWRAFIHSIATLAIGAARRQKPA